MKAYLQRLPHGDAVLPLLLAALVVLMFIAAPLADIGVLHRPLLWLVTVTVILSGLLALGRNGPFAIPIIALGLVLIVLQVVSAARPTDSHALIVDAVTALFVSLLSLLLLRGVFSPGRITIRRIVGAVVVYLLLGLLFAILFDVTERLAPGAFSMGPDPSANATAASRFFYLSIITLTSVGFGDMAPVHPFARSLVMLEAVVGQIYTTVLLAWLVSLEIAYRHAGPPDRR